MNSQAFRSTARLAICLNTRVSTHDHFTKRLSDLVSAHGMEEVATRARLSSEYLGQIIKGTKLTDSGNARGLGPLARRKLEAAFPGWAAVDAQAPVVAPEERGTSYAVPLIVRALASMTPEQRKKAKEAFALLAENPEDQDYADLFVKAFGPKPRPFPLVEKPPAAKPLRQPPRVRSDESPS